MCRVVASIRGPPAPAELRPVLGAYQALGHAPLRLSEALEESAADAAGTGPGAWGLGAVAGRGGARVRALAPAAAPGAPGLEMAQQQLQQQQRARALAALVASSQLSAAQHAQRRGVLRVHHDAWDLGAHALAERGDAGAREEPLPAGDAVARQGRVYAAAVRITLAGGGGRVGGGSSRGDRAGPASQLEGQPGAGSGGGAGIHQGAGQAAGLTTRLRTRRRSYTAAVRPNDT